MCFSICMFVCMCIWVCVYICVCVCVCVYMSAPGALSTAVTSVLLYSLTRATLMSPGKDETRVCRYIYLYIYIYIYILYIYLLKLYIYIYIIFSQLVSAVAVLKRYVEFVIYKCWRIFDVILRLTSVILDQMQKRKIMEVNRKSRKNRFNLDLGSDQVALKSQVP